MKVLIIEDEGIAADRLAQLLLELDTSVEVVARLDSVKSSVKWFSENDEPDLAFFDIQLADGKSFEIFERAKVTCPIIFTTAYDQYAIQAFKVNSVDYLLKPIVPEDLKQALNKFKSQTEGHTRSNHTAELIYLLQQRSKKYKERFVIKVGDHLKSVLTADVELFYSQDKATYVQTTKGQKFILDFTLDQIAEMIDPQTFFRINRKYIIHLDSLGEIITFSNSRLKLVLKSFQAQDIIVSRERVGEFKSWLDR
ncbi:MAG: response regulator transcription factor [Cytophagales bacterium]|nr:response regulator transcription factor [Cytophagales bacterium]